MLGSAILYAGLLVSAVGLLSVLKPLAWMGISSRAVAAAVLAAGVLIAIVGLILPAAESRVSRPTTRLDEFMPAWQFNERHTVDIAAPPDTVFAALMRVRADEITFFRALTWIRRGGRELPAGILNAGADESLIAVALKGGFVALADDPPRELVIGKVVVVPPGTRGELTRDVFKKSLPPGFAIAAMNFLLTPDGNGGTHLLTETRVSANSPSARRQFAVYWRFIYPGSAIIRRMWLRAVRNRALAAKATG